MTDTQAQEAARLAEWHRDQAIQWRRAAAFEAADHPEPTRSMLTRKSDTHVDAADLIERQAARIAELEKASERITNNRDMWKGQCERQAAELARMREPLNDDEILHGFCKTPHTNQFVVAFKAGVRFAEAAHGITKTGGIV